jgi:hypothetical protein
MHCITYSDLFLTKNEIVNYNFGFVRTGGLRMTI